MVALNKTWVDTINQPYSSNVDQAVQYRETFYALKALFLAAGWTLELSGNGTTASSSDNLPNAAACVYGTHGTQPLAYFVVRAPAGYGNPVGADLRIQVVANNSNADTTPQTVDFYAAWGTYSLSGTPLTNRATTAAAEQSRTAISIIPWATATTGYLCTWRTTAGDVLIAVKDSATSNFSSVFWVNAETSAIGHCAAFIYAVGNLTSCLSSGSLTLVTNFRQWLDDALNGSNALGMAANMWGATSWTLGLEGTSGVLVGGEIDILANAAAGNGRFLGRLSDVRAVPTAAAFNAIDSLDTDPQILRCAGDILLPVTAASGSFT